MSWWHLRGIGYTVAMFPADLTSVTAVGGTQLTRACAISCAISPDHAGSPPP